MQIYRRAAAFPPNASGAENWRWVGRALCRADVTRPLSRRF